MLNIQNALNATCHFIQARVHMGMVYGKSWLSPRNAVTGVGVTLPCAVTWTTAVFMKPPVSQHAAVTAGASNTRLTCALPTARVTEGASSWEDRAYRVAGTGCRRDGWHAFLTFLFVSRKTCVLIWLRAGSTQCTLWACVYSEDKHTWRSTNNHI